MYFVTYSGKKIDIENITADDICLKDIAHHLTKICRFGGALEFNKHYSVANHCLTLCNYTLNNDYDIEIQKAVLMHDASEAYLGDIVAGIKPLLKDYKELEIKLENIIAAKYELSQELSTTTIVQQLDKQIVLDEAKELMPHYYKYFEEQSELIEPLDVPIQCDKSLEYVEHKFLMYCWLLDIVD